MKKSELKELIKRLIKEQTMSPSMAAASGGAKRNSFTQRVPLNMSEEETREVEQAFLKDFPGGVIDLGGPKSRLKITFRFKLKWPPEFVLTISW